MSVVWTQAAQTDLEKISDYIRTDNPARAASFVNQIVGAGEAIADMPRGFPLVPRLEQRGIRRRPFGRYLDFLPDRGGKRSNSTCGAWCPGLYPIVISGDNPLIRRTCIKTAIIRGKDIY